MERGFPSRQRIAGLSALLDHEGLPASARATLQPLGHWLCFPPDVRQSMLGRDGHSAQDEYAGLPRRMWAGSRIRFLAPIAYECPIERHTTTLSSVTTHGRNGRLQHVTLRHEIMAGGTAAIVEDQDLVYREAASPMQQSIAVDSSSSGDGSDRIIPDETLLFRYSAVTLNARRIHYDRPYATIVEGYPDLAVHGPLTATLLLDHYQRLHPARPITGFGFRAVAPLFVGRALTIEAADETITAFDDAGRTAMIAQAENG